jgi:hypothetical protein
VKIKQQRKMKKTNKKCQNDALPEGIMPNTLLGEVGPVVMIQNTPRNAFFCHHKLSLTSLEHGEATYLLAYATRGPSTFFIIFIKIPDYPSYHIIITKKHDDSMNKHMEASERNFNFKGNTII